MEAAANVFGRGTAAGDAIYKCYMRPTKESTLDPELLEKVKKWRLKKEAEQAAMLQPRYVPKSKAVINCPRVGLGQRMTDEERARRRLIALPHKKQASAIQEEMRNFSPLLPPLCKRPLITTAEKDRLALIFQLGEMPQKPKKFTGVNQARYAMIDKRFQLKGRFEALADQVKTLRAELSELQKHEVSPFFDEVLNNANGDKLNILEDGCGGKITRQNVAKAVKARMKEQELTVIIREAVEEMKIIDADIRQLENEQ